MGDCIDDGTCWDSGPGCLAGSGPLQAGQSYCATSPTAAPWTGTAPAGTGMCLAPIFPFVGTSVGGVCRPVISIPSPWGLVATAVLGFLLVRSVMGK